VMQVRARGQTGHAAIGDDIALADARAGAYASGKARQMTASGGLTIAVFDDDEIPVLAAGPREHDGAIACRHHGRARRNGEIDPLMHTGIAENGMKALSEAR